MADNRKPKNPGDHMIEQVEAFRPLAKFLGIFNKEIRKQFRDIEVQLADVKKMMAERDVFAKTYGRLGWVCYDRFSTDIISQASGMSVDDGESLLITYHLDPDNLRHLGHRFNTSHYEPWSGLYERAVERVSAKDYMSAVPLVLSIIDGICTTSTGKHPFSGGADAPVFDSQTSGPGGLSEGLALLGSTRRKLDIEPISSPFRHGIVHGLNPNYDRPIVAAKAFNLLHAMVDYFDRRRDEAQRIARAAEDQKPVDILELGRSLRKNAETRRAIDAWRARPSVEGVLLASSGAASQLPADSPEGFATEYLDLLVAKNYGGLAKRTVDYTKRPFKYRAGRIREDLKEITITQWSITGVEDTAAAISCVEARLEGLLDGRTWDGKYRLRLIFADENHDAMVRGEAGGAWAAMPDFLTNLWVSALKSRPTSEE